MSRRNIFRKLSFFGIRVFNNTETPSKTRLSYFMHELTKMNLICQEVHRSRGRYEYLLLNAFKRSEWFLINILWLNTRVGKPQTSSRQIIYSLHFFHLKQRFSLFHHLYSISFSLFLTSLLSGNTWPSQPSKQMEVNLVSFYTHDTISRFWNKWQTTSFSLHIPTRLSLYIPHFQVNSAFSENINLAFKV